MENTITLKSRENTTMHPMYPWPTFNNYLFFFFLINFICSHYFLFLCSILKQIPGSRVLDPVLMCGSQGRGQISPHIQAILWTPGIVLQFNSIMTLPEIVSYTTEGFSPRRLSPNFRWQSLKPSLLPILLTNQLQIGGPHDFFLG